MIIYVDQKHYVTVQKYRQQFNVLPMFIDVTKTMRLDENVDESVQTGAIIIEPGSIVKLALPYACKEGVLQPQYNSDMLRMLELLPIQLNAGFSSSTDIKPVYLLVCNPTSNSIAIEESAVFGRLLCNEDYTVQPIDDAH